MIRRLLERAERTENSLHLLLLNLKQAFDKVSVDALEVSLHRYSSRRTRLQLSKFSQQTPFYDLAYADDTALVAGAADRAEQLLSMVETIASHGNLRLNWEKSVLLKFPSSQNPVYIQHRHMVKEVDHAKYLGIFLSRNGTTRKDVTECLRKARKHLNTLRHF